MVLKISEIIMSIFNPPFKAKLLCVCVFFLLIMLYISGPPSQTCGSLGLWCWWWCHHIPGTWTRPGQGGPASSCLQTTVCGRLEAVGGRNCRRFIYRNWTNCSNKQSTPTSPLLKLQLASESPGGEHRWLVSTPRVSSRSELSCEKLNFQQFPGDAGSAGLGPHLENHCCRRWDDAERQYGKRIDGFMWTVNEHRSGLRLGWAGEVPALGVKCKKSGHCQGYTSTRPHTGRQRAANEPAPSKLRLEWFSCCNVASMGSSMLARKDVSIE